MLTKLHPQKLAQTSPTSSVGIVPSRTKVMKLLLLLLQIFAIFEFALYRLTKVIGKKVLKKVKLSSCLTKHYAMKACGAVDVWTHVLLTSALLEVFGQLHASASLLQGKELTVLVG
jgi:hypothetical protein